MHFRAVIFDLDDTLHDKSSTLRTVAKEQYYSFELASLGVDAKFWQTSFVDLNNLRIEKTEVFSRLAQLFDIPRDIEALLLNQFDANLGKSAKPFVGAQEMLESLKAHGLKVGIVTNGRDTFQRSKIIGMGISEHIDAIVTSGGFGRKKPDPEIFLACLTQLGVLAGEAIFVGDDLKADIEPAVRLGMRAIWKSASKSPLACYSSESLNNVSEFILENT